MFGYVTPCKAELKICEFDIYKSYYCGLCKRINRDYSFFCRLFLNYDCAYLYLLYAALSGSEQTSKHEGCAFNPCLKKDVCYSAESGFAAGVNMLLTRGKLRDSFADDKNVFAKIALFLFSPVFKKADRLCHEAALSIDSHLCAISRLEREGCRSIDDIANEFGMLLAETVAAAPFIWLDDQTEQTLYDFAFNLGRFIYLIDAADDIKKDLERKRYNVYIMKYDVKNADDFWREHTETVRQDLFFALKEASYHYSKLQIRVNRGILDNIMYAGLPGTVRRVIEGSNK